MSQIDRLGRHWRVKQNKLQAFVRDPRTKKDEVKVEMHVINAKEGHKCGGQVVKVAGTPRLLGPVKFCSKCSAQVK